MPTINAHTRAGDDRPANEDWYAAMDDLVVVLDGATIRTDTGCVHGLPWYVRQLGTAIVDLVQRSDADEVDLAQALADAINRVSALHAGTCDLTHPGSPSAAVGIVRLTADAVSWLVLGDITVMVDTTDGLRTITDERISSTGIDLRRECDRWPIGSDEKMAAILAMKDVELAGRNREYWIAATDPTAVEHALVGSVPRNKVSQLAVCSDGAMRVLSMTGMNHHTSVLEVLRVNGPAALIDQVRTAERHDPRGSRVPRNKATDDATAVHVDMNVPPVRRIVPEAERQASIRELAERGKGLLGSVPTVTGKTM